MEERVKIRVRVSARATIELIIICLHFQYVVDTTKASDPA